jgi:hypothetical protein
MINFGLNSASILAQVNLGTNPASILGIFLAVAGAGLFFLRSVRPELSRDQDIFFAAVGLLCGFILIFQGWRLDPILQFGQLLLVGTTIFFAVESIRLRSIATEQAKRNTPIEDRERRVSDNYDDYRSRRGGYKAEMDVELEPLPDYDDDRYSRPRIRGSRDERDRRDNYYEDETPRRSDRRSSDPRMDFNDKPSRDRNSGRPGRSTNRALEPYEEDDWGSSKPVDDRENPQNEERRPRRPSSGSSKSPSRPETRSEDDIPPRQRKRRSPDSSNPRLERDRYEDDATPVDFKPIEESEERPDRTRNFDDVENI